MQTNRFNFIDIKNEKNKDVNINNVYLSANNPRYTLIEDINEDLTKFIVSGDYKEQNNVFKSLLKSEGDFLELEKLLESIYKNGFENKNEPIYLVEQDKKYIVAEGNRRLMCLKLIDGDFKLPKIEELRINYQIGENKLTEYINDDDYEESDQQISTRIQKNYNNCCNFLQKIKNNKDIINVHFNIINNSDDLWDQIYDRHLSGNKPGMREWSRSKYFADLLNIFKDGLAKSDEPLVVLKFHREWLKVKKDFQEAQFIYSCIFFNVVDENAELPDFLKPNNDILNIMINSNRISALERNHSLNKIKKLICKDIFNFDESDFYDKFFKISFIPENNRIQFISKNKFKYQKFLSWIYEKWLEKKITTRDFKDNVKNDLINEIKFSIINNIDLSNHLSYEKLLEINEFDLDTNQLNKLISANSGYHSDDEICRFRVAKNIKEKNKFFINKMKITNKFSDNEPIKVFDILKKQLSHNNQDRNYFLNAVCATLRSLFDQAIMWLLFSTMKSDFEKSKFVSSVVDNGCMLRLKDPKNIEPRKLKIIGMEINDSNIDESLNNCLTDKTKKDEFKLEIMDILNNENKYIILNEHIHALHRIYTSKEYNSRLKSIEKMQDVILNLISNIDLRNSYFNKFNELVIDYIRDNNK